MCGPSGGDGGASERARQAEAERQARIEQGAQQINQTFAKFDDPYFAGVKQASDAYYLPQVDQQYKRAQEALVLALGRQGLLQSSAGARQLADLSEDYNRKRTAYADQGVTLSNQYKSDVERNRGELLNQLSASADPSAAATSAAARADLMSAPPTFSPIANLFSRMTDFGATDIAARNAGYPGFGAGLYNQSTRGQGSSRIIQ